MKYLGLLFAALAGLFLSAVALMFALLQGEGFATVAAVSLIVLHLVAAVFAVRMAAAGKTALGAVALLMPVAVLYVGVGVVVAVQVVLPSLEPDPPEFAVACRNTGIEYLATPASPVRSVAFDWEDARDSRLGALEVDSRGRVVRRSSFDSAAKLLLDSTQFIEERQQNNNAQGQPYLHEGTQAEPYGVPALTADALVLHTRRWLQDPAGDLMLHELTVSDRRDGRVLARMRYVLGKHSARLCGPKDGRKFSEYAFVVRALGLGTP